MSDTEQDSKSSWAVVAHIFNLSVREAKAGGSLEVKASLVYKRSSGTARATQRNPISKRKKKHTHKERDRGGRGRTDSKTWNHLTSVPELNSRAQSPGLMETPMCRMPSAFDTVCEIDSICVHSEDLTVSVSHYDFYFILLSQKVTKSG